VASVFLTYSLTLVHNMGIASGLEGVMLKELSDLMLIVKPKIECQIHY